MRDADLGVSHVLSHMRFQGPLKSDLRAEGNFPIVARPTSENNFVSHFQTQAYRTQKSFDSCSRIKCRVHVFSAEIRYAAGKSIERGGCRIKTKIHESAFNSDKHTDRPGGLKLWTE